MNKAELIEKIAEKSGLSKKDSAAALAATIESIVEAIKANDSVSLVGFGTFSMVERPARTGRNPRTGEPLQVAARRSPKFSPAKGLSAEVD